VPLLNPKSLVLSSNSCRSAADRLEGDLRNARRGRGGCQELCVHATATLASGLGIGATLAFWFRIGGALPPTVRPAARRRPSPTVLRDPEIGVGAQLLSQGIVYMFMVEPRIRYGGARGVRGVFG
jgi:hypothetical protein